MSLMNVLMCCKGFAFVLYVGIYVNVCMYSSSLAAVGQMSDVFHHNRVIIVYLKMASLYVQKSSGSKHDVGFFNYMK